MKFLEMAISLSVQLAIVTLATYWLGQMLESDRVKSRLWTASHVILLLLIALPS